MFVAVMILHLLNGSVLMERQSERHFIGVEDCGSWLETRIAAVGFALDAAKMPVKIEARCDRLS